MAPASEARDVRADGAYDAGSVYEAVQEKGDANRVKVLIPPGLGAQLSSTRSLVSNWLEAQLAGKILSTMTSFGMSDSVKVG